MSLETATTISGLNASNPTASDPKSQGDDHIRMIKAVLQATFPYFSGPLLYAHDNIASKSYVDGLQFSSSLPSQSGNAGKFVTTDGTTASWANIPNPQPASTTLSGLVYLATIQECVDGVQTTHAVTPAGLSAAMTTVYGKRGAVVPTGADIATSLGFTPVSSVYGRTGAVVPTQAELFGTLGVTTLSGSNTGDETAATIKSKLGIATLSGSNTGDETTATILSKCGATSLTGSNTGDETATTIKSKLGVSTLSGSNTGDQTLDSLSAVSRDQGYNNVGSYCLCKSAVHLDPGSTAAGSSLYPACIEMAGTIQVYGTALSGTWRLCGHSLASTTSGSRLSLWQRIA